MAPVDTYWTINGTGATLLIEPTAGDAVTVPYTQLPGSDGVDYTAAQVWADARFLFDDIVLDPDTGQYPERPDFDAATLDGFMRWHSRHQVDFILEKGTTALSPDPGDPPPDPLPDGTLTVQYYAFTDGPTFVLGQDGRTVYQIQALSATDIATMPLADQLALAGLAEFQDLADALLIRPATGETADEVRDEFLTVVDALIADITARTDYDVGDRDTFLAGFMFDPEVRLQYYPHFFVEELNLYKLRLNQQALFSEIRINDFVSDLRERFERIKSYYDVSPETPSTTGLIGGVNTSEADAVSMKRGLGIFIEMESQLFQIALARAYVIATGTMIEPVKGRLMSTQSILDAALIGSTYDDFGNFLATQSTNIVDRITLGTSNQRFLDGPSLIFVLQTFSNYEAEAEAQVKSEELQLQSKLLEDYSKMQEILNETLNKFEPVPAAEDSDEPPAPELLAILDLTVVTGLTTEQKRIVSMFDTTASAIDNTYHPIEAARSSGSPVDFRPTLDIATDGTLTKHEKTKWDALSVNIGEATKIIGQSSQMQMDAINRLSQEKNRHYELGSNVLNKLTELLREITS